jgi:hypothetical protein
VKGVGSAYWRAQLTQQLSAPSVVQSEALRESKRREEQLARKLMGEETAKK